MAGNAALLAGCLYSLLLSTVVCARTCPASSYLDDVINRCVPCDDECLACIRADECTKCKHVALHGSCLAQCPDGFYDEGGVCKENWRCRHALYDDKCVETCPSDTYRAAAICIQCHIQCDGCSGPGDTDCVRCKHASFEEQCIGFCPDSHPTIVTCNYSNEQKYCAESCSNKQCCYLNDSAPDCSQGEAKCPTSSDQQVYCSCTVDRCQSDLYRFNNTCIKTCPADVPYHDVNDVCTSCHDGYIEGQQFICVSSCKSGLSLASKCVDSCPAEYPLIYHGECVSVCSKGYLYKDECLDKCPGGLFGYDHQCIKSCPPEAHLVFEGCCWSTCPEGAYLYADTCFRECPINMFNYQGKCVSDCPPGYNYSNPYTKTCINECNGIIFNNQCLATCPLGYYNYGYTCSDCHEACDEGFACAGPHAYQCERCRFAIFESSDTAYCVTSCPRDRPYIVHFDRYERPSSDKQCVKSCSYPACHMEDQYECLSKCPESHPFWYQNYDSTKTCFSACPLKHPYMHPGDTQCLDSCVHIVGNETCLDRCPESHPYRVVQMNSYCCTEDVVTGIVNRWSVDDNQKCDIPDDGWIEESHCCLFARMLCEDRCPEMSADHQLRDYQHLCVEPFSILNRWTIKRCCWGSCVAFAVVVIIAVSVVCMHRRYAVPPGDRHQILAQWQEEASKRKSDMEDVEVSWIYLSVSETAECSQYNQDS